MNSDESDFVNLLSEASAWDAYTQSLRDENRHVVSAKAYFDKLLAECLATRRPLDVRSELYRARIMPPEREHDTNPLPLSQMGAPPSTSAPPGRLNPERIAYFYAALDEQTAIAEVRPWRGAKVTVARFDTEGPMDVADLTGGLAGSQSATVRIASLMIGRPVHRDDPWTYLGSQYLAETMKAGGLHGVLYDSAMKPGGTNVALFAESGLRGRYARLFEVIDVRFTSVCHAECGDAQGQL